MSAPKQILQAERSFLTEQRLQFGSWQLSKNAKVTRQNCLEALGSY
jgi:hypothetical protein